MATALPLPKYHQIYLVLREQIQEGHFDAGLPAETVLSKDFDAGRVTVRRALEQLASEGLIIRQAGRGTRPTQTAGDRLAAQARAGRQQAPGRVGLLENIVSVSMRTSVKVLDVHMVRAPETVAHALEIPVASMVQKAVRRRSSHLGPVSYITTYVPEAMARGFGRRELTKQPILRLLEASGVKLGLARQIVSARQADAVVARELDVAVGTALLAVSRLVVDTQERPVQWLQGLYRPDRYEYRMEVSKVGSLNARISVKESLSD